MPLRFLHLASSSLDMCCLAQFPQVLRRLGLPSLSFPLHLSTLPSFLIKKFRMKQSESLGGRQNPTDPWGMPSLLLEGDQTWFRCGSEKVDIGSKVPDRWLFFFSSHSWQSPSYTDSWRGGVKSAGRIPELITNPQDNDDHIIIIIIALDRRGWQRHSGDLCLKWAAS